MDIQLIYFSRMYSPIGRSAQFSSALFKVSLRDLGGVNRRLAWQLYNRDLYRHKDDINVICELLAVKHGDLELDFLVLRFWMLLLCFYVLSNILLFTVFLFYVYVFTIFIMNK